MANDMNNVRMALARATAERKLPDDVIDGVAKQIASAKHPIRGLDVCTHGICFDYIIDGKEWWKTLPELIDVEGGRVKGIEFFPWGIINPDLFHVKVEMSFDAIPPIRG